MLWKFLRDFLGFHNLLVTAAMASDYDLKLDANDGEFIG
jgi:hypothetical protein